MIVSAILTIPILMNSPGDNFLFLYSTNFLLYMKSLLHLYLHAFSIAVNLHIIMLFCIFLHQLSVACGISSFWQLSYLRQPTNYSPGSYLFFLRIFSVNSVTTPVAYKQASSVVSCIIFRISD